MAGASCQLGVSTQPCTVWNARNSLLDVGENNAPLKPTLSDVITGQRHSVGKRWPRPGRSYSQPLGSSPGPLYETPGPMTTQLRPTRIAEPFTSREWRNLVIATVLVAEYATIGRPILRYHLDILAYGLSDTTPGEWITIAPLLAIVAFSALDRLGYALFRFSLSNTLSAVGSMTTHSVRGALLSLVQTHRQSRRDWFALAMFFIPREIRSPALDHILDDREALRTQGHGPVVVETATLVQVVILLLRFILDQLRDLAADVIARSRK